MVATTVKCGLWTQRGNLKSTQPPKVAAFNNQPQWFAYVIWNLFNSSFLLRANPYLDSGRIYFQRSLPVSGEYFNRNFCISGFKLLCQYIWIKRPYFLDLPNCMSFVNSQERCTRLLQIILKTTNINLISQSTNNYWAWILDWMGWPLF